MSETFSRSETDEGKMQADERAHREAALGRRAGTMTDGEACGGDASLGVCCGLRVHVYTFFLVHAGGRRRGGGGKVAVSPVIPLFILCCSYP